MRVLLVEPAFHKLNADTKLEREVAKRSEGSSAQVSDETLWYPPLGLMKLSRFHKDRGDEVSFAYGCDESAFSTPDLFNPESLLDRVYISTVFTYGWDAVVEAIRFYREAVGGTARKVFVGGIMASLMVEELRRETGATVVTGILKGPEQIDLNGDVHIDSLPPDYDLVDERLYAINQTFYGYTTRGCIRNCPWCGVPVIEPKFQSYIDIKPMVCEMRKQYGDKPILKLMDNNILASPHLERIVDDLVSLGYGRGSSKTDGGAQRAVDFNQGLDARQVEEESIAILAQLNLRPMRIAFDQLDEASEYIRAVELAREHGFTDFSNYMLYNFQDTPLDLYERIKINIQLNQKWQYEDGENFTGGIYSYPMRYAPIDQELGQHANRRRDPPYEATEPDWTVIRDATWNPRFVRSVEIMRGAAHGALSTTPDLAWRTVGHTFEEFLANLYMPETLLRNRNKHEKKVYPHEPQREPGTGEVERFREFILDLVSSQSDMFKAFQGAVTQNRRSAVHQMIAECESSEVSKWLTYYLMR